MFRSVEFPQGGVTLRRRLYLPRGGNFGHQWHPNRWFDRVTAKRVRFLARRLVAAVSA